MVGGGRKRVAGEKINGERKTVKKNPCLATNSLALKKKRNKTLRRYCLIYYAIKIYINSYSDRITKFSEEYVKNRQ